MVYQVPMEKTKKIKIMDVARFHDELFICVIVYDSSLEPLEVILLLHNTIEPHNYLIYDNCNRDRAVNKEKLK